MTSDDVTYAELHDSRTKGHSYDLALLMTKILTDTHDSAVYQSVINL